MYPNENKTRMTFNIGCTYQLCDQVLPYIKDELLVLVFYSKLLLYYIAVYFLNTYIKKKIQKVVNYYPRRCLMSGTVLYTCYVLFKKKELGI